MDGRIIILLNFYSFFGNMLIARNTGIAQITVQDIFNNEKYDAILNAIFDYF